MKFKNRLFAVLIVFISLYGGRGFAQGPPITADSPIMLGGERILLRTLTEIRNTDRGTFVFAPLMFHYLPSSNSVVAVHLPFVHYDFASEFSDFGSGSTFGDLQIMGKYQIYRKDGKGKTLRMVVKTMQNLPTGKELGIDGMSSGHYEGYYGTVLGYETLKYGISAEMGYTISPNGRNDKAVVNLGFGLPLLKPSYPVDQLNLYFEYDNEFYTEFGGYRMLFAQGVQYAVKDLTMEAAVQIPLVQDVVFEIERNYSIFLGARYVF